MDKEFKKDINTTRHPELTSFCHSEEQSAEESMMKTDSSLSLRMTGRKAAFTLAETIIALTVLGIVAAITVPQVVRRQIEAANRAKIKKVMTIFDFLMNKLTTENNLKSNGAVEEWADDNCQNTANYFKVVKKAENPKEGKDFCRFRTADGVWWDIENIMSPTVALKESELDNPEAKTTFNLKAWFDNVGLRVDDLNAVPEENKLALQKLYNYVSGKESSSAKDNSITPPKNVPPLKWCIPDFDICFTYDEEGRITSDGLYSYSYRKNGDQIIQTIRYGNSYYFTFDEDMNPTGENCKSDGTDCLTYYSYGKNGDQIIQVKGSGGNNCSSSSIGNCTEKTYYTYDENMNPTGENCKSDGTDCLTYYSYQKNGNQIIRVQGSGGENCSRSNIESCSDKKYDIYDENMNHTGQDCNADGTGCEYTFTVTYQD